MPGWDRSTPWRQGQFLKDDTFSAYFPNWSGTIPRAVALVASHDCDLAAPAEAEPYVELVVGQLLDESPSGDYTNGKNPRQLHLTASLDGSPVTVALFARHRPRVMKLPSSQPRSAFVDYEPSERLQLADREKRILQAWLAARFRRQALPDELDRRLKDTKLFERFQKALKKTESHVLAVFLEIEDQDTERRGENDPYGLRIVLVYDTKVDADSARAAAIACAAEMKEAFMKRCLTKINDAESWKWLELIGEIEVIADTVLTFQQSNSLTRWNFDYLSFRTEPPGPMSQE